MQFEEIKFTGKIARLEFTSSTEPYGPVVTCIAYDSAGERIHAHAAECGDKGDDFAIERILKYFCALLRGDVLCVSRIAEAQ